MTRRLTSRLKTGAALAAILAQVAASAVPAGAFCGFYVAKADAKLFNKSSKVVLVRDGDETAITMASDYEGEPKEFALVVPVPTFIERNQIRVVDSKTVDHLDAFTAPRLVEYFDPDPCETREYKTTAALPLAATQRAVPAPMPVYAGVKVEAQYDVAEYDISILSAEQSDGLVRWLTDNGYRIPVGAEPVIGSYIRQKMHFFVAKVNVERMQRIGNAYLRPLQVRYATAKFMLPLRLGTVNANGPQDLIVFALSARGRVEASNYRTVKVPSDFEVPLFVKTDFANFYRAAFDRAVARENMSSVFVEYAWDMGWCDPCASPPMSKEELSELGAGWSVGTGAFSRIPAPAGMGAFVTRLHVRYDATSFPEDITFVETSDRDNFQGRYILQHPFAGAASCKEGVAYWASLPARFKRDAQKAADITGWPQQEIEARMAANGQPVGDVK
jgi:hypothetical protein